MTEWRPVVGWGGLYEVSNGGHVCALERIVTRRDGSTQRFRSHLMRPSMNDSGYLLVRLSDSCVSGRREMARVHRLVAEAFVPNTERRPEVNHIDGVKTNNIAVNLEWVTARGNRQHAWDIGLRTREDLPIKRGAENGRARLTEPVVRAARERHRCGEAVRSLAQEFGVDRTTMKAAIHGTTWTHVPLPDPPKAAL